MSYSKINIADAPLRTRTDEEPGVKMLGYELRAAEEPRPNNLRFNYFVYEEGQAVRRHTQIEQEEVFFIIEGSGRMEVDGEEFDIEAGDAIVVDPGPWRTLIADERMLVFAVGAPNVRDDAIFEEDVEEADDLPEGILEP